MPMATVSGSKSLATRRASRSLHHTQTKQRHTQTFARLALTAHAPQNSRQAKSKANSATQCGGRRLAPATTADEFVQSAAPRSGPTPRAHERGLHTPSGVTKRVELVRTRRRHPRFQSPEHSFGDGSRTTCRHTPYFTLPRRTPHSKPCFCLRQRTPPASSCRSRRTDATRWRRTLPPRPDALSSPLVEALTPNVESALTHHADHRLRRAALAKGQRLGSPAPAARSARTPAALRRLTHGAACQTPKLEQPLSLA